RVLDRDGGHAGQQEHDALVLVAEDPVPRLGQIEIPEDGATPRDRHAEEGAHRRMSSFLGVPIAGRGAVFGNLYLTEARDGIFSDEDERVVLLLAGMAAVAIENA